MKSKFTLIELLVVIAIIAIIAALLLPGLKKAKDMAKRSACQGNLKQIGVCVVGYMDDNAGWLPQSDANIANNLWRYQIAQYAGINVTSQTDVKLASSIFKCPSWNYISGVASCNQSGYAWNQLYLGYLGGSWPVAPVKMSQVLKPSGTIMAADTTDWYASSGSPGQWDVEKLYWPSLAANFSPNLPVGNRHSGGVNILWCDFHVSWMPARMVMAGSNSDIDWYFKIAK